MRMRSRPPSSLALARASCLVMTPRGSSLPSLVATVTRSSVWVMRSFMGGMNSFLGGGPRLRRCMAERAVDVLMGSSAVVLENAREGEVGAGTKAFAEPVNRATTTVATAEFVLDDTMFAFFLIQIIVLLNLR